MEIKTTAEILNQECISIANKRWVAVDDIWNKLHDISYSNLTFKDKAKEIMILENKLKKPSQSLESEK